MKKILVAAAVLVVASLVGLWVLPAPVMEGLTGRWRANIDLPSGGGNVTFEFSQKGDTLSGVYRGSYGTAPLSGTVSGDRVAFSFETKGTGRVRFDGTLTGTALKGTCDYGQTGGEGTWSAVRGTGARVGVVIDD